MYCSQPSVRQVPEPKKESWPTELHGMLGAEAIDLDSPPEEIEADQLSENEDEFGQDWTEDQPCEMDCPKSYNTDCHEADPADAGPLD